MRYENEHRFRQTGLDGFRTQSTYNCHSSLGLLILHRHVVSFRYLVSSFSVTIYSHILYHTQLPQWCDARRYHWRELPPVSFLSRQKCLSRQNPSFVATKVCLSRQNGICRNKIFLLTKAYFCLDKHVFVATKMILVAAPTIDTVTVSPWHLVSWSGLLNYSCHCSKVLPSAFFFLAFFFGGCLLSVAHHNVGSGGHLRAPLPPVIARQLPCLRSLHNSRANRSTIIPFLLTTLT